MEEMDELVKDFLVESHENLDQLDRDLVSLESDPDAGEKLAAIFRTVHTIKGTCGFLNFGKLESVAHVGENLLSSLREGEIKISATITSALLALADAIREILVSIEQSHNEGDGDYSSLITQLKKLQDPSFQEVVKATEKEKKEAKIIAMMEETHGPVITEKEDDPARSKLGEILVDQGQVSPTEVSTAINQQLEGDDRKIGEILVENKAVPAEAIPVGLQTQTELRGAQNVSETTIRVDVHLIEKLMNLVGELVLARNQILQYSSSNSDNVFLATSQRLNLITTELQEGVMKTRMQPINNVWNKFPRVVRDLSQMLGKKVRLEMVGKETELDKTVIEAIKDPLTHIIRNSIDHGIEMPDKRLSIGKNVEGVITLRAYHEGGQVNIEIVDDGGGIDPEKIRGKAMEKSLMNYDQLMRMNEKELLSIIFMAGFSTAEKVTNISGRGVGMDVVKNNIEKIGGSIEIDSKVGKGSRFNIKIPLTLAIIPALIVLSGGNKFCIPQVNLQELVRLEGAEAEHAIEMIHGAPVFRLRGKLLPLVYLDRELGLIPVDQLDGHHYLNIVCLIADGQPFGLIVDKVCDTQEIVVKPLTRHLKGLNVFAGATIMGDGSVILILDAIGLAQKSGVLGETRRKMVSSMSLFDSGKKEVAETLLLFKSPDDGRMAIPLSHIARLEEFETGKIEMVGDHEFIQYGDHILPLMNVNDLLEERRIRPRHERNPMDKSGIIRAIICTLAGRSFGLVVDHILDIVEIPLKEIGLASRELVLGTVVIQNRITEVLDLEDVAHRFVKTHQEMIDEYNLRRSHAEDSAHV